MNKIKEFITNFITICKNNYKYILSSILITVLAGQISLVFGIVAGILFGLVKEKYYEISQDDYQTQIKYNIISVVIGTILLFIL